MSEDLETVLAFVKSRTTDIVELVNTKFESNMDVKTDTGTLLADKLRGKLAAYYAVKYFIEHGMKHE